MKPAREVKTERFSRAEGKTPAFVEGEVQKLLGAIETSTHTGLRDRALLATLICGKSEQYRKLQKKYKSYPYAFAVSVSADRATGTTRQ